MDNYVLDLSVELNRYSTFVNFPKLNILSLEYKLAKSGFYYIGPGDKVECHCCKLKLENWKDKKDPFFKHKELFPSCSFINELISKEVKKSNIDIYSENVPNENENSCKGASNFVPENENSCKEISNFVPEKENTSSYIFTEEIDTKDFSLEKNRLDSYEKWPLDFIDIKQLVNSGLYYSGERDLVICFYCSKGLHSWEINDDPILEHKRISPDCFYINSFIEKNFPLVSNEKMKWLKNRLESFSTWNKENPLKKIRVEELADAGFYYIGKEDCTKCFSCDGGLKDWNDFEDPWILHARYFPKCGFVFFKKGNKYIEIIKRSDELNKLKISNKPKQSEIDLTKKYLLINYDYLINNMSKETRLAIGSDLENNIGKKNYKNIIKDSKLSNKILIDVILSEESYIIPFKKSLEKNDKDLYSLIFDITPEKKLEESVKDAKERITCKICMEDNINIVFIPCAHFVCCFTCSLSLNHCPICRRKIQKKIKTFLT